MSLFGLESELVVFYYASFTLVIQIIGVYRYQSILRSKEGVRMISRGLGLMLLSNLILVLTIITGQLDDFMRPYYYFNLYEETVYSVGYLLFLSVWLYGNNYFVNKTIMIPDHRKKFFKIANNIINSLITTLVLLALISLIGSLDPDLQESDLYFDIIDLFFAAASQLAIILFLYFIWNLRHEKQLNKSKLTQARLELVIYSIIMQILVSITILIAVIMLISYAQSEDQERMIEMTMFLILSTLLVFSSTIIIWSLYIPNWIRKRFNLLPERFEKIKFIETELPSKTTSASSSTTSDQESST